MVHIKIYYRTEAKTTPLEEMEDPHLKFIFKFTKNILTFLEEKENLDIEVNFIEFNTLIRELLLDERLLKEEIEKGREGLKRFGGYHIEYKEMPGNYLKETFKDEKICYVCLVDDLYSQIIILLHEIFHFISPLDESEIYKKCQSKDVDGRSIIKMGVRNILNEYYINYFAYKYFLGLVSGFPGVNINSFIAYLESACHHYIEGLDTQLLNKLNYTNDHFNEKTVKFLHFFVIEFFFKSIMYFLGVWRVFEKLNLKSENVHRIWDEFINGIKVNISPKLSEFIILLKDDLIIQSKYKPRVIVRYFDLIFIRFFERDFREILKSFMGEKIDRRGETPFSLMIKDILETTLPIRDILEPLAAISKQLSEVSKLYQKNLGNIVKAILEKHDDNSEVNNS